MNLVPFGYQPFVFARQVAELDQITGGRLLLTLVPGLDLPGERAALGISKQHRGKLLDELLPDLRRWWSGGSVTVPEGDATELRLSVRPRQEPLEIWLGGKRAGGDSPSWTTGGWLVGIECHRRKGPAP